MKKFKAFLLRLIKWVYILLIMYPIIFVLIFYAFFLRAWIKLGYPPRYNQPDPKTLGFEVHRNLVYLSGELLPYSLLALILACVYLLITKKKFLGIRYRFLLISVAGFMLLFFTLLTSIAEWFAD